MSRRLLCRLVVSTVVVAAVGVLRHDSAPPAMASGIASYCSSLGAVQSLDGSASCVMTFTASTTWTPPAGVTAIEYLVVGGGGGGRAASAGTIQERGGAGGAVVTGSTTLSGAAVTVTVGAGGASSGNGSSSSIQWSGSTAISAAGGATGAGPNGAGIDGPSSSITGAPVIYGSSGGKAPNFAGGSGAGRGANSSLNNCTGGLNGVDNRGGGGGGGDRCTIDFGMGTSYSYGVGGRGGSGVVIIRWVAFSVSSFAPVSALTGTTGAIDFTLSFTGDVDPASLDLSDIEFSGSQTATGCTVSAVTPTSSTTFTISVTGCSEGTVIPRLVANGATSTAGVTGPGSTTDASPVTIDRTAPTAPVFTMGAGTSAGPVVDDGDATIRSALAFASGPTSSDASAVTYSCSLDGGVPVSPCPSSFSGVTPGEHDLTVWATDAAGNVSAASTFSWNQVGPPSPTLAPASDTGSSDSDRVTADDTPTIDLAGLVDGTSVTLRAQSSGQTDVTCTFTVSPTTRSCDLALPTDGVWSVDARVTDDQGETSAWGTPLPITLDRTSPTAPSTPDLSAASDTGGSSTDDLTADPTPRIDVPGGSPGDLATVTATPTGGGASVSCTFTVGVAVGCDLPTLADGEWSVAATFTDPAGNISAASPALDLTIDSTAPGDAAPRLAPSSDTGVSSSDGITADPTPRAELEGLSPGEAVTITATPSGGGSPVSCSFTAIAPTDGCDLVSLTDGDWSLTASVTDPAGNVTSTQPGSLTVDTTVPTTPGAPDLVGTSDLGASDTDDITADPTPTVDGGGTDGDTITITATPAAGGATLSCSYVRSPGTTSCDLPELADGGWSLTAVVTDPAGNTTPSGPALDLTIDTTAPSAPQTPDLDAAADDGASSNDDITSRERLAITVPGVTVGDRVTVTATGPGGIVRSCSIIASGPTAGCEIGPVTNGEWSITATRVDPAGNSSAASDPLVVTARPEPPVAPRPTLDPATGTVTVDGPVSGDTVTVTATGPGGMTVSCSYVVSATVSGCTLTGLTPGEWSIAVAVADPIGRIATGTSATALPDPVLTDAGSTTDQSEPARSPGSVGESGDVVSPPPLPSTGAVDLRSLIVLVLSIGCLLALAASGSRCSVGGTVGQSRAGRAQPDAICSRKS